MDKSQPPEPIRFSYFFTEAQFVLKQKLRPGPSNCILRAAASLRKIDRDLPMLGPESADVSIQIVANLMFRRRLKPERNPAICPRET
jgi:hypothetical protein